MRWILIFRPGLHRLRLVDDGGRIVDQILFTVR
jgi:penicillin-binding protein 1C